MENGGQLRSVPKVIPPRGGDHTAAAGGGGVVRVAEK